MIHKTFSSRSGYVRVTFELPSCVWADRIFLCGEFNDWSKTATPMQQARDGTWRVSIDLAAGTRVQFRYLVDGHWQTDYHADGFATNAFGTDNSVVVADLPGAPGIRHNVAGDVPSGHSGRAWPQPLAEENQPHRDSLRCVILGLILGASAA